MYASYLRISNTLKEANTIERSQTHMKIFQYILNAKK